MENTKKANIEVTICEKTLYNYINSGLFLNINKSHLPYNKKDKLMKLKEKKVDTTLFIGINGKKKSITNNKKIKK